MLAIGQGRAPGKVILLGEHAVVYGYPAIALAIDRFIEVTLYRGAPPAAARTQGASAPPHQPSASDTPSLAQILARAALCLGLPADRLQVQLRSHLPPGVGLGSSAALSVATLRALSRLMQRPYTDGQICRAAYELERLFHGQPSGIDNTTVTYGGVLRYSRNNGFARLDVSQPLPLLVVVGRCARQTRVVIERLRALREERPSFVESRFARIGALARLAERALSRGDWQTLGALFLENHALLRELDISTPELDEIVALASERGAHGAKLTGGGGGGAVVCLVPENPAEFATWFRARGWEAFPVKTFVPERGIFL